MTPTPFPQMIAHHDQIGVTLMCLACGEIAFHADAATVASTDSATLAQAGADAAHAHRCEGVEVH